MSLANPILAGDTDAAWRAWGRQDPYFGVITDQRFRRDSLDDAALEAFFRSGRSHVNHVLQVCRAQFNPKFEPKRVLDFGCGVGRLLVGFSEIADEVVGVDISEAMLAEARANCERRGAKGVVLHESDDALSRVEGRFDLVHSVLVLQHIEPVRVRRIVGQLCSRLADGGIGALHVTYAKSWFGESFGQEPAPAEPPRLTLRQRLAAARAALFPPPPVLRRHMGDDPEMLMFPHRLNDLLFSAQQAGARTCHLEFTDHGGELGVFLFFQRRAG